MTTLKIIFRNNSHTIQIAKFDTGKISVVHQMHNITRQQYPIRYESGKIAYDFPEAVPAYLKPYIVQSFIELDRIKSHLQGLKTKVKHIN